MAGPTIDLGAAEITKDINDPAGEVDQIKQDILDAKQKYRTEQRSTANSYIQRLKDAQGRIDSLLSKHQGKPYLTSSHRSRLNDLKSRLGGEISETRSERP